MLACLPFVFLLCCAALVGGRRFGGGPVRNGLRDSLVPACIITGVWLVLGTEVLSPGRALRFETLLLWWAVPVAALGAAVVVRRRGVLEWVRACARPGRPDGWTVVLAALASGILLATGIVAAATPVNTWDALSYHMPRQVYWLQNGTVAHYPAHDLRQLQMPPLAEYIGAHLMALSGGDGWAGSIQWLALVATALVASAVARLMGAAGRGQALAALLVASLPAAASQATNGKNDIVLALWVMILAYLAAGLLVERTASPRRALEVGGALGLAVLTKGTAYVVAAPLCVAIGVAWIVFRGWRGVLAGIVIACVALAINAGHFARNQGLFGSPLGVPQSKGGYKLRNETFSPAAIASNIVRNVSLHTGTPSPAINRWQQERIEDIHRILGIASDDPQTTAQRNSKFQVEHEPFGDGGTPAPVHLLMGLGITAAAVLRPRRLLRRPAWPLYLAPAAGFLAFCTILMWQPWHHRLHIPIMVLIGPAVAAWAVVRREGAGEWRSRIAAVAGLTAGALAWPTVLYNGAKPMLGDGSVFRSDPFDIVFHWDRATARASGQAVHAAMALRPPVVGLRMAPSPLEYALQRLILAAPGPAPLLVTFNPNFGRELHPESPVPDVVIGSAVEPGSPILHHRTSQWFEPIGFYPPWGVYTRPGFIAADDRPRLSFGPWRSITGLAAPTGPFPDDGLPVVCWATERLTTIKFLSDGAAAALEVSCRRHDGLAGGMTVALNGAQVDAFTPVPAPAFTERRVGLAPRRGVNELVLDYVNSAEPGAAPAVLFRTLRIIPQSPPGP